MHIYILKINDGHHIVNGVWNCVEFSKGEKIDELKILFVSLMVARLLLLFTIGALQINK